MRALEFAHDVHRPGVELGVDARVFSQRRQLEHVVLCGMGEVERGADAQSAILGTQASRTAGTFMSCTPGAPDAPAGGAA